MKNITILFSIFLKLFLISSFIFIIVLSCKSSYPSEAHFQNDSDIFSAAMVTPKSKKHLHMKNKYMLNKNNSENNVTLNYSSKKDGTILKISYEKFKAILMNESFPQSSIDKMWCIARNESSFNPLAYNYNNNGSFDVGLFQINQTWKRWCRMRDKDLLEVKNNAHCALLVLKKQGYFAWVTFRKFCS